MQVFHLKIPKNHYKMVLFIYMKNTHRLITLIFILIIIVSAVVFSLQRQSVEAPIQENNPLLEDLANEDSSADDESVVEDSDSGMESSSDLILSNQTLTGASFTWNLPENINARDDEYAFRFQNFDFSENIMPESGFFLRVSSETTILALLEDQHITVSETEFANQSITLGEGCGVYSGPCPPISKTYFFKDHDLIIQLSAEDETGLQSAEELILTINWN